ncbi:MAG: hypothetical protein ABI026_06440 [Gemmatimonadaceae bacterium]
MTGIWLAFKRDLPRRDSVDRSTAAGVSNLPLQAFSSAGPTIASQLMQSIWVSLPLEIAAASQSVNTILYHTFFHKMRLPEELADLENSDDDT